MGLKMWLNSNTMSLYTAEHHRELEDLQLAHADTINELEKMRKLLQLQHNINKDYKKEVFNEKKVHCRQP